MNNLVMK